MTITALDVAFVSALAAVAAPVTAGIVARSTQRHERKMRLFEEQRAAGVQILRESQRKSFLVEQVIGILQNFETRPVPEFEAPFDAETQLEVSALADAFLPEDVRTARREFEKICWEALQEVGLTDLTDAAERNALLNDLLAARTAAEEPYRELRHLIRDDLA